MGFRKITTSIVIICCLISIAGCVTVNPSKKRPNKVEGQSGRPLPFYSITIDANYDQRLDEVISGYKLLPVMIRNVSLRPIIMDLRRDQWVIVSENGKRHKAIKSLRINNPKLWRELPDRIKDAIDYPEIVPVNYSVTFDLLFSPKVNLEYFREIRYYNAAFGQEFIIEKEY